MDITKVLEVYGPLGLFAVIAVWLITRTIPEILSRHEIAQTDARKEFQKELAAERQHREALAESQLETFKSMADTCHEQQRENASVTADLKETIARIPCNVLHAK